MAYHELNTGTLFTLSSATGQEATRAWSCDTMADVVTIITALNTTNRSFPDATISSSAFSNCVPISITVAPFNQTLAPGTVANIGTLPVYNLYLVTVHYQFLHSVGAQQWSVWPIDIPAPTHPVYTTLTLRIRNSGQFLSMTCLDGSAKYVDEAGVEVSQLVPETSLVMLIPMRELHITCDRYTKANMPDVKKYIGKVNSDGFFLGCAPDTLLCEAADVDQSFAPDMSQPDGPHRFRITALFKERRVPKAGSSNAIGGWNYEYVAPTKPNPAGFYKVILPGTKTLRYDQMSFANFFTG